jgi:hypothetical protein
MNRQKRLSARAPASVAQGFREVKKRYALTRLQWLLKVSQESQGNSAQITAEGVRQVSELLAGLAGFGPQAFKPLEPRQIAKLLADVLKGIQKVSNGKPWYLTERLTRQVQPGRRVIRTHLSYGGDLGAAVRWNAQELAAEHISRISRCAAANCGRLFIKQKAATFCSSKCAGKVRFARWYTNHKQELSELRRKRYVERVKQQDRRLKRRKG